MTVKTARGFTLIELMITIVIVAILGAVAYPSYNNAVLKSKRAEGRNALLMAAQLQERSYTTGATYTTDLGPLFGLASGVAVYSGEVPTEGYYTLTAVQGPGGLTQGYTLTATAGGAPAGTKFATFVDPVCGNLTLTSTGQRGYTGTGAGADKTTCW